MNRRHILTLGAASAVALTFASMGGLSAQTKTRIVVTSQPSGTSQYLWSVQHLQAVAAKTGFDLVIQESSGTEENMFRLEKAKTAQLGTMDGAAIQRRWGNDHSIRTIVNFAPAVWQIIVAADSGVSKLADLDGKSFNPGPTGGGSTAITKGVLEDLGIKPNYVDGTINDALEAFMDRRVVGLSYRGTGTSPTGGVVEASASRKIKFIEFSDDEIAVAAKRYPYLTAGYIEPNTYASQTERIKSIATWQGGQLGAHKDLPEEIVYQFVKAYFEVLPEIAKNHPNIRPVTPENSAQNALVPLHLGALKYYRERGVNIPDSTIPPEAR